MKTKDLLKIRLPSSLARNDPAALIDLKPILEECMGDRDLLKELLSLFDGNALEFIGAAKIHLRNSEYRALGHAAHKIKAGLTMMRTESLHSIIVLIQKECDKGQDHKHLQFLCDRFTMEYPTAKKSIERAKAKINLG